jgi:fructose-bisphosphate aldolase, class II
MKVEGKKLFDALRDEECIIMACNTRLAKGVVAGIFDAAREADSAVIMELAKSECGLDSGYTGLTPSAYAKWCNESAGDAVWALHADHLTVKKGTAEEVEGIKKLVSAQVEAGYTSFAIDASFLFNHEGGNLREELSENIRVSTEIAQHIYSEAGPNAGLEVEVGEIGRKSEDGFVVTSPEEAVTFIKALNENRVYPQVIAIANGSTHGNIYENGKLVEQVSIDVPQTRAVAQALRDEDLGVRIAQHGITGTPLPLIKEKFPHGDITKGNVGTYWQNLSWQVLNERKPDLMQKIREWVFATYGGEARAKGIKSDDELFGKYSKKAHKRFFGELYAIDDETTGEIRALCKEHALKFFDAFKSPGTAEKVRKHLNTLKQ